MNCSSLDKVASFLLRPVGAFCNLNCSYCYYHEHQKVERWDEGLTFKILHDICEYVKLTGLTVRLCWHGGEPMLAGVEFYEDISNNLRLLKKTFDIEDNKITNTIQTNGTLINQKWCDFFKKEKFGIGLSFDIMKKVQDECRSNSYNKVIKAISLLHKNHISFGVNSVCSEDLITQNAKDVFNEILKFNLLNFEFSQMSWFDRNHEEYNQKYAKFMMDMFDCYMQHNNPNLKFRFVDSTISQLTSNKSTLCTHSKKNCGEYPTIDARGNLHFCDNYDEKKYLVDDLENLKNISLIQAMRSQKYKTIRNSPRLYSEDCPTCNVKDLCQGGCPGNFDHSLNRNIFCSAYKQIFGYIKQETLKVLYA